MANTSLWQHNKQTNRHKGIESALLIIPECVSLPFAAGIQTYWSFNRKQNYANVLFYLDTILILYTFAVIIGSFFKCTKSSSISGNTQLL